MTIDFIVAKERDAVIFNDAYRNYTASAGYLVSNNIYNRLILNEWYRPNPFPDLATHWECLDGGKRWRFHLNQSARWHDNEPLTALDVAYTHTHAKAKGYSAGRFLSDVEDIIVINKYTVDYILKEPNAAFITGLGNFIFTHILPRHLYEGTDWSTNPYNLNPVGSGPFKFAEWVPGEHVILEAVKDHWGPQPEIDRLIIKIVESSEQSLDMALRGEVHFATSYAKIDPSLAAPNVEVGGREGPGLAMLDFNHGRSLWQDSRVREAVSRAIDRSEFISVTDPGVSQPWPHYMLGSIEWALNSEVTAPEFDLAEANALLDEANVHADENGVRRTLEMFYMDTYQGHDRVAAIVKRQLSRIGFEVNPIMLNSVDWTEKIRNRHEFDLILAGGGMAPDPDVTAGRFTSNGTGNMAQHRNHDVDRLYEMGRATPDRQERAQIYKDLQAVWRRDYEWVPLIWYGTYHVRSTDFYGWADQLDFSIPWWNWGRIRPVSS